MKKYATVRGITLDGKKFRPSAWTEMLIDNTKPTTCTIQICQGVKCIEVDMDCSEAERILEFAKENELQIDSSLPLE